jgi:hypothetical protein
MAEIVADCPRCGANRITFDVRDTVHLDRQYDWLNRFEAFCRCRNCKRTTTFVLKQAKANWGDTQRPMEPALYGSSLGPFFECDRYISLVDRNRVAAPEHTPKPVAAAFDEAASCLTVQAWNGAAAMFRLSIDLATKPLLPAADTPGLNRRTRRDLAPRLNWLLANGFIPRELADLSDCIREDGNDGAHDGTLTKEDAADLLDFAIAMFERLYTEPERLKIAKARRESRRKGDGQD